MPPGSAELHGDTGATFPWQASRELPDLSSREPALAFLSKLRETWQEQGFLKQPLVYLHPALGGHVKEMEARG